MAKAKKKPQQRRPPKGGYKPERPVVSVRFHPRILADIRAEADARGLTVTDVINRRWMEYEFMISDEELMAAMNAKRQRQALDTFKPAALKESRDDEWQQMLRTNIEATLRSLGYTRITGPTGALWAEPGTTVPASIVRALTEPKG
jgi:hypothetical protein